ncbi:uncharacterized protein LOC134397808 [Elgaria multicarinata webbii]|uniref:uncharacterized protein LOC134397808 n=1 Tax=Elgaria multicarinata webbii TaxID=159646 RepID=UPI002FCCE1DE
MRATRTPTAVESGGGGLLRPLSYVDNFPVEFSRMETEDYKPYNATPYYCNICKIYCASPVNLQTHFLGYKHKAVEEALKAHGIVKPLSASGEPIRPPESLPDYIQTEPERDLGKTLEEQLNSCKYTEPAIGLQYVTEYKSKENLIYECNLCGCQSGLTNMFMHVLGVKHRLAYLKRHYPEMADVKGRGSNLNKKLKEIAKKVEQDEGRKKIMVTMDFPGPKDDRYAVQVTDSLVTWFSEDDVGIEEKKKEDAKKDNAEGAKKAEETRKDANAQCDDGSRLKNNEQQNQNTEQLENALLSDSDSEEFTNNEELLKYLKTFEIVDEEDASFILKVTQKLTNSLVSYRQKVSERNNSSELNPNERVDQSKQSMMTFVKIDEYNTEKHPPVKHSCEDKVTKMNINPPFKRKASQLNANDNAKNKKLGTFVSTFQEVPSEDVFSDVEIQDTPSSEECLPNPPSDKSSSSQNQPDAPSTSLPGPSISENDVISRFFSSIRNMSIDDIAATLHKISASNPSFHGLDVQNVIKILTESGTLKEDDQRKLKK